MDADDLIAKLQSFVYVLRRGQLERILATLAVSLPVLAEYLRREGTSFSQAAYAMYALCAVCALWLFVRIWRQAAVPPPPPDVPVPSAIKGLLPFTAADGKLFARLGRRAELQSLLAFAQNDQIGISVVRGESGAGKTSLLQAGLAYTLGEGSCVYWEAVPARAGEALLHAVRSRLPEVESLESLPEACPKRCVLVLDQFEQLRANEPAHAPIFALLNRVADAPAPHRVSVIVGFRREYAADWLDFEQSRGFRAEQEAVNLLAPRTAGDALITLASEAGFTLEQELVENFVASIQREQGVSPVDVAIGVLSLANFVQQRGSTHVGLAEYKLAGGAEGLLLAFVQQKLEEIPGPMRAPLLKGIVLALVDPSSNQRIAEGATAAAVASKAETPENSLLPCLERWAHPRIRLLEKAGSNRYRLPHERLVPVLRRLAGGTLASVDQLRLTFESEYGRWRETHNRRHLLGGKDLRKIWRSRDLFVQGANAAGKMEYLTGCLRRRAILRLIAGAGLLAVAIGAYGLVRAWDRSIQRQKLMTWGLSPDLFTRQYSADGLYILGTKFNDLSWLRSTRLRKLTLEVNGSSLKGLENLTGLTSLFLFLGRSQVGDFKDLGQLKRLRDLTLEPGGSPVHDLNGLESLTGLTSLSLSGPRIKDLKGLETLKALSSLRLELENSEIKDFKDLQPLTALTSLQLYLNDSQMRDLKSLEPLTGLTSLTLSPFGPQVKDLKDLERLRGLKSLSLYLNGTQITDLKDLRPLTGLTSLLLSLNGTEQIKDLKDLRPLTGLTSLSLSLAKTQIKDLKDLQTLTGLTSLTLGLYDTQIKDLKDLEPLTGLTSLSLSLYGTQIKDLKSLEGLKGLKSLELFPCGSQIKDLKDLQPLTGLASLKLRLYGCQIENLKDLEPLRGLTSLELYLNGSQIKNLSDLQPLTGLTSLTLDLKESAIKDLKDLEPLKGLTSLRLNLYGSQVKDLSGLEPLGRVESMRLLLPESLVSAAAQLGVQHDHAKLWIVFEGSTLPEIPPGFKFVGLADTDVTLDDDTEWLP